MSVVRLSGQMAWACMTALITACGFVSPDDHPDTKNSEETQSSSYTDKAGENFSAEAIEREKQPRLVKLNLGRKAWEIQEEVLTTSSIEGSADFGLLYLAPKRITYLSKEALELTATRELLPLFSGRPNQKWLAELEFDLGVTVTSPEPDQIKSDDRVEDSAPYELVVNGHSEKHIRTGGGIEWIPLLRRNGTCRLRLMYNPSLSIGTDITMRWNKGTPDPKSVSGKIYLRQEAADRALQELTSRAVGLSEDLSMRIRTLDALSKEAGGGEVASLSKCRDRVDALAAREDIVSLVAETIRGDIFVDLRSLPRTPTDDHPTISNLLARARFDMEKMSLQRTLESWEAFDEEVHLFYAILDNVVLR